MAYEFLGPRKIVAGDDALNSLPNEVRSLRGARPLIVTDAGIAKSGLLARLTSVMDKENMTYRVFSGVKPDPDTAVVEEGRTVFVEGDHDLLVAFGGGSSIDAAKVISFLATNEGGVKNYVGMPAFKNDPVAVIAIPTTAGTGSEVTQIAIVTDKEQKLKLPVRSPQLFPKTALLDPSLLAALPSDVIAYTGMDAFSHALESFLSVRSNIITQQLSASAIRLIYPSLVPFKDNPADKELASRMLHGSCLAGIAFTNGGLGAVHALAHPIGSHYHLPHGLTCALFLRQVLDENREAASNKYSLLLETLGISSAGLSSEACADKFIAAVDEFMERLGIPKSLGAMGIHHEVQPMMIEDAMKSPALMANPKKLDRDEVEALLWSAR